MNPERMRKIKHELRTPVNHILGYSELVMESASDSGDDIGAELAKGIQASGQTLARLLERNLLGPPGEIDDARMNALRLSLRPVVADILETLSATRALPSGDVLSGDLDRIRRAAQELMLFAEAEGTQLPD